MAKTYIEGSDFGNRETRYTERAFPTFNIWLVGK